MVGSVSSSSMAMAQQSTQTANAKSSSGLTSSQLETISSVLEGYDSSNLSATDASSIVEALSAAGIEPSSELESALADEGFDAKEIGGLAGVGPQGGGGGMPPPPPSEEEEDSVSSLLDSLLNLEEDEEDEDSSSTITSNSTFDEVMEYTSRILSLNDTSKTEVMDMLDKLSSSQTEFNEEEVSSIVKNSLSSILGDSSNYNSFSFYA